MVMKAWSKKVAERLRNIGTPSSPLGRAKGQRDQFRQQRDQFRKQRDQFRQQRDSARELLEELAAAPVDFLRIEPSTRFVCLACEAPASHVTRYPPPVTGPFSRLLVMWCERCGFGWVPTSPFILADYYAQTYAVVNRKDRDVDPEKYFDPNRESTKYFRRARSQVAKVREFVPEIQSMLDFGSGPGYALFVSGAKEKYAVEYDEHSTKYLDYIGAKKISHDEISMRRYDLILSSHSLEHLFIGDLESTLKSFHSALKPQGVLYVEVPGASLTEYTSPVRHEPHTLFFSPESLWRLVTKAGFNVIWEDALGQTSNPRLDHPIYSPKEERWNHSRGRLSVIARSS